MKFKYISPAIPIIIMLTFFGCEKIEKEKEPISVEAQGIKINKEQKIMDLASTNVTESETIDTIVYEGVKFLKYEMKIEGKEEEVGNIEPGIVIYIPSGDRGGKLLFVYEVENLGKSGANGKGLIAVLIKAFQTTPDLYFNYENAVVEFSTPDNRSKINLDVPNKLPGSELNLAEGEVVDFKKKLAGLEFTSSPDRLCSLSISTNLWNSGNSYISVDGSLSIQPAIDFYMRYEPEKTSGEELLEWLEAIAAGELDPFLLSSYKDKNYYVGNLERIWSNLYIDLDRELTFNIHIEDNLYSTERIPIGSLSIPTVPIWATIEAAFVIDFDVLGTIDLEIYKKKVDDIVVGFDFDKELPEPQWYCKHDQSTESGLKLVAKFELTAGVSLVLETEIYVLGIIGPKLSAAGFLEATASFTAAVGSDDPLDANWKLLGKAGVRGNATLDLSAFHLNPATWEIFTMVEKEYKDTVYIAPDHLTVEQGDNQIGIMGQPLPTPITVGASDSRNELIKYLPVPMYFETSNGTTDPSGRIRTSDGTASTIWTLDDVNEQQKLNVYFKDGLDKKGEITINASAESGQIIETGTFIDNRDGNEYNWIKLGDQIWMAENLAYLPSVDVGSLGSFTQSYYYVYDFNSHDLSAAIATSNYETFGVLYNYVAANGACPDGWHLPSDDEWKQLEMYMGMSENQANTTYLRGTDEGSKLAGNSLLWTDGGDLENNAAFGTSGFTAIPGGRRDGGGFSYIGIVGYMWSSTSYSNQNSYGRDLNYIFSGIIRNPYSKSSGFSVRCVEGYADNPIDLPTLTTSAVTSITRTSATSGGNITNDGGADITARGVCWSTSTNPTTADNNTSNGTGTGTYSSNLSGLTPGTTYYVRAYATNCSGTAYGNEVSFTTDPVELATLTTDIVTSVGRTSAISGGNIIDDGGGTMSARGVCWSINENPTITDSHTDEGSGNGDFTSNITGLNSNTTYFVRAYATNSAGTAYGNEVSFTTLSESSAGTFTDGRDEYEYNWIQIGDQIWMAENLAYLPSVNPYSEGSDTDPLYYVCGFDGNSVIEAKTTDYYITYGAIYNWPAAMEACPDGWHLPSDEEWKELEMCLGMSEEDADEYGNHFRGTDQGSQLAGDASLWMDGNLVNDPAFGSSGFTGLPGGGREAHNDCGYISAAGCWWSSTDYGGAIHYSVYCRAIMYSDSGVERDGNAKDFGVSVRCVKD